MEFHDVTFILCHFQMENANEDPATASNFTASEETVHIEHSEVIETIETIRRLQESMPSLNLLLNHIPFWANY